MQLTYQRRHARVLAQTTSAYDLFKRATKVARHDAVNDWIQRAIAITKPSENAHKKLPVMCEVGNDDDRPTESGRARVSVERRSNERKKKRNARINQSDHDRQAGSGHTTVSLVHGIRARQVVPMPGNKVAFDKERASCVLECDTTVAIYLRNAVVLAERSD